MHTRKKKIAVENRRRLKSYRIYHIGYWKHNCEKVIKAQEYVEDFTVMAVIVGVLLQ